MKKVKLTSKENRTRTHRLVLEFIIDHKPKWLNGASVAVFKSSEKRFREHHRKMCLPLMEQPRQQWLLSRWVISLCILFLFSSCATLFTPKATDHQKHKPACGEPKRELRPGAFALDLLLFPPALIVDFATGKIYKPEPGTKKKECEK